jgi:hypothetical protein
MSPASANVLSLLGQGDRRSVRGVAAALTRLRHQPALFRTLIHALQHEHRLIRARAADAVEKWSTHHPAWLRPYKARILIHAASAKDPELRWHYAPLLARLELQERELPAVRRILSRYLRDPSRIVQTMALQALVDLAQKHPNLRPWARRAVRDRLDADAPALRSRSRRLWRTMTASTVRRSAKHL